MKTQKIYLEHANMTVNNLDQSIHFFQSAFPDFIIRGGGDSDGRKWIHLGNDTTYIAINEAVEEIHNEKNYSTSGFNHIGFVVEDLAEISEQLLAAGYKRSYPKQVEEFRIRDYFFDADGNEFEFVQYLSEDIKERNFYNA
ncbi:MAG: VOC family protein [Flavobacteriales bacterium]|nr:VOC family protein [Flavobacteriales bacterium]